MPTFTQSDKTKILRLKSAVSSYYNLQMKKIGDNFLTSKFFSHCIITGGCIASLYHNEPVNDIDVYAVDTKSLKEIKDHIILGNSDMIKDYKKYELEDDANSKTKAKMVTDNAVTLTNDVQFVYLGTASECRPKFDFIHCMPWFEIATQRLYISKAQFDAIQNKQLVLNPSFEREAIKDRRVKKYQDRGWTMYDNSSI